MLVVEVVAVELVLGMEHDVHVEVIDEVDHQAPGALDPGTVSFAVLVLGSVAEEVVVVGPLPAR